MSVPKALHPQTLLLMLAKKSLLVIGRLLPPGEFESSSHSYAYEQTIQYLIVCSLTLWTFS